jgi:DNA polymerase-3 subunit gamma/tau
VLSLADVRRIWPDLLEAVKKMRRFTWILLSQNAQVIGVDATSLTVGFRTAGARDSFLGGGSEEILRQAAIDMIGADWKIEVAVDPSADPGSATSPRVIRPAVSPPPAVSQTPSAAAGAGPSAPPSWAGDEGDAAPAPERSSRPAAAAEARSRIAPTRQGGEPVPPAPGPDLDADAHRDDPSSEDNALDSTELLQRELGATVIEEIPHD